jgi:hypothetical protein
VAFRAVNYGSAALDLNSRYELSAFRQLNQMAREETGHKVTRGEDIGYGEEPLAELKKGKP